MAPGLAVRAPATAPQAAVIKGWHDLIGELTHADAICDRLIHTAYVIELQGPSLRETRARAQQSGPSGGVPEPPTSDVSKAAGPRKRS